MSNTQKIEILKPGEQAEVVENVAMSTREKAALSHQVDMARTHNRSLTKFRSQLTEIAQMSQPVAMEMMYSVPRAGKQLVGPSVRFAEAVVSCWENNVVTAEIIGIDGDSIVAEGKFYDCEKNTTLAMRVRRRIVDKDGKRFNTDMIGVAGAAASAIARRSVILNGIPKALWADIFEKAKQTAAGSAKSVAAIRDELLKVFTALGITHTQILNALDVEGIPDIGGEEILAMNAWKKQLQDKECTIEDIFGSAEDEEIEKLMVLLDWNETKKRTSRDAYRGRRPQHLEYLRAEAKKRGIEQQPTAAKKKTPAATKNETPVSTDEMPEPEKQDAAPVDQPVPTKLADEKW